MSIPRKKGGTAAKVLSTALSAAMVVAFTPVVALGQTEKEAQVGSTQYDTLAAAVEAAASGDTITLLKDVTVDTQITLEKEVVFDGDNKTLTRREGTGSSTDETLNGTLLVTSDETVVKNLTIDGLNTKERTESGGWDKGEFGLKVYGAQDVRLSNVKVTGSNAGIQVNSATACATGDIDVSGNEWGGIEVCNGARLDASAATLKNEGETAKVPVAWSDGPTTSGTLIVDEDSPLYIEYVDDLKSHYYLDAANASNSNLAVGDEAKPVKQGRGLIRTFNFTVEGLAENAVKDFVFSSEGTTSSKNDPFAALYKVDGSGLDLVKDSDDTDAEKGNYNFSIFASLGNGSYRLQVTSLSPSCDVSVSVKDYVDETSSYSLYADKDFYSGTAVSPAAANLTLTSKLSGEDASSKFDVTTWKVVAGDPDIEQKTAPSTAGDYYFKATPKAGANISGNPLIAKFSILDPYNIGSYDYEADVVSVYGSPVTTSSLSRLNLKVTKRDGSGAKVTLPYTLVGFRESVDGDTFATISEAGDWYAVLQASGTTYTGTVLVPFETITERIAAVPTARTGLVYNGSSQTGVYAGTGYTVTGGTGTNAGGYSAVAKLADGYVWANGSTENQAIPWYISQAKIAVPTAVTGLKYTGSAQTGVSAASNVKLSGTYSATNAGSYTATASLPSYNYVWADNTSSSKVLSWSIAKGSLPVTVGASKATVYKGTTYSLGYSYAGDGAIAVKSSNPNVATATKTAAGTVTVTPVAAGTTVVTITAAGTSNCEIAVGAATITVTAPAAAPSGSFINADGTFAGGSNGGVPGSASDAQQAAASYKVTTPAGSATPTVAYLGGAATGSVSIPSTVKDQNGVTYRVTSIEPGALKGSSATKVTVGGYVKVIGSSAFSGCASLTGLTIGKSVSSVGKYVVKGCDKLKAVTVKSAKLTKLGIRNLVKGTKVTAIKCPGLSKQTIAKYAKWAKAYNKKVKVQ